MKRRGVQRPAIAISFGLILLIAQFTFAVPIRTNAGFTTTTFLANDDGTYPANGPGIGTPPGANIAQALGFTVDFFGNVHTDVYINNNGNVTFDSPLATFTPFDLTSTNREIIAPFFGDVDTRNNGALVTFGQDSIAGHAAFGVNWDGVDYYSSSPNHGDQLNRFQLVLIDRSDIAPGDFDIEFNYEAILWETGDASGGTDGLGGSSARVGWSNGSRDPGTFYELPGSAVNGAFLDSGPAGTSLIHNELNSAASLGTEGGFMEGRYLFRARGGEIIVPTPEPASIFLLGLGFAALSICRRRRDG